MESKTSSLAGLENHPVLGHFLSLCRIPHPSHREQQLSDWLLAWGKARGLECRQDEAYNIYLRRPASPGYEAVPPILFQAHMDMVCEKAPGVLHNFDCDPIPVQREGDLLTTGGQTTLGADDCIGVALAMAALTEELPHPVVEALFTTAEEDDFSGAKNVQGSWFTARQLINLDNSVEGQIITGSSGGAAMEYSQPAPRRAAAGVGLRVTVEGLAGGHSGEDIHKGRGNAILLLARLLWELLPLGAGVAELGGGNSRVALPRQAQALLALPAPALDEAKRKAAAFEEKIRAEYAASAPELRVCLEAAPCPETVAEAENTRRFLQALWLLPNGILEMNGAYPAVVEASCNLGEVYLDESYRVVAEVRAAHESLLDYQLEKCRMAAELTGGSVRVFADYPGWLPANDSRLAARMAAIMERQLGRKPEIHPLHAGLEGGALAAAIPGLDAISMGPAHWGLHSPTERLSISSVDRLWEMLKALLAEKEVPAEAI